MGDRAVVSADEARRIAKATLGYVARGVDPQAARHASKAQTAVTFASNVPAFLADAKLRLSTGHFHDTKRYLEKYWSPLNSIGVNLITRNDISRQVRVNVEKHGEIAANRARSALSAFFMWAIEEEIVTGANPVLGSKKGVKKEHSRDRVLSDVELSAVWHLSGASDFGSIVRLLILTAARREEIGRICWSEIDRENAVWTLPANRSKNGKAHVVPLAPIVMTILDDVPRRLGRDLLFGSRDGVFGAYSGNKSKVDEAMQARLLDLRPWRLHDLRRTVATGMADLGVLPHIVEAVLNHQSGTKAGVAGIYNRATYAAEKRAALILWAEHVLCLVKSNKGD